MATALRRPPTKVIPEPPIQGDLAITFRVRRHSAGSFKGLWELAIMDEKGRVKEVISDADALLYCLDNLHGILEDQGL